MPCLTGSAVSLAALFGGSWTLFIQDRYRRVWWLILVTIVFGWWMYITQWREPWVRIVFEVISITFLIGLGTRLWYRVVKMRKPPAGYAFTRWVLEIVRPYLMNRVTLVIYTITATFVTLEVRGKATFSAWEYGTAVGVLVTWLAMIFIWRHRRRKSANAEVSPGANSAGKCPVGF